jgi:carbonic anhydrase/acetyltransferase-like protein (isoleucine patch superfamily)
MSALMFGILSTVFVVVIFGLPLLLISLPALLCSRLWVTLPTLLLAPFLYCLLFVVTAGVLSCPFQKAIVPGKFSRDLRDPLYRGRRFYGLCWTCVYYFKPVYFVVLSLPLLKTLTFRLFGYRGAMGFTVYPDTWIRDLPLLDIGDGAYIANRVTIGTNMALNNGRILVDRVSIGRNVMIGHLAVVAPGATLEDDCEVGTKAAVGIRCRVSQKAVVQPGCVLNHKSEIGARSVVGSWSYIGLATRIGAGVSIPTRTVVPNRTTVELQQDADSMLSSQVGRLTALLAKLQQLTDAGLPGGGAWSTQRGTTSRVSQRFGEDLREKCRDRIAEHIEPKTHGSYEIVPSLERGDSAMRIAARTVCQRRPSSAASADAVADRGAAPLARVAVAFCSSNGSRQRGATVGRHAPATKPGLEATLASGM